MPRRRTGRSRRSARLALLDLVQDQERDLFTCLRLAVSTGARRSQLLALRWSDIDLPRASVSFTRALVEGPNGSVHRPTKTHRTCRVALDTGTAVVLAVHQQRSDHVGRGQFVFSADGGLHPWRPNDVTKRFIRARKAAGLEHFRLHDLRHFMATEMLAAGVPIATVSQRFSHARASTTLDVYGHAIPGGDEAAAETLAAIIGGADT